VEHAPSFATTVAQGCGEERASAAPQIVLPALLRHMEPVE